MDIRNLCSAGPLLRGQCIKECPTLGRKSTVPLARCPVSSLLHSPSQCTRHRLTRSVIESFFMKRHAGWCVNADEQLGVPRSRQPDLHLERRTVVQNFIVVTMMQLRISPIPEHIATNSHSSLPILSYSHCSACDRPRNGKCHQCVLYQISGQGRQQPRRYSRQDSLPIFGCGQRSAWKTWGYPSLIRVGSGLEVESLHK